MGRRTQDQMKRDAEEIKALTSKIYEMQEKIKDTMDDQSDLYGHHLDKSKELVKQAAKLQNNRKGELQDLTKIVQTQEKNLQVLEDTKSDNERIQEIIKEQLKPYDDMRDKIKEVGLTIKAFILNPWTLIVGLVVAGIAFFKDINAAAQNFATTTGLAVDDTTQIRDNARQIVTEMAQFGVTSEEAFEASKAIVDQFGSTERLTKETTANVLTMSKALGLSADESAALLKSTMDMLGASEETATAFIAGTAELARQAKVAPKAVLQDVAQNAEAVAKFSKAGGENIAQAAVQARQLGVSFGTLAGMAEKLLDFESSIEGEMNAMVLTGRQINLERARAMAIEGDLAGMQREILKQVGSESEFNEMNIVQRKALADAIGVGVAELGQMVSRASDLEKVSTGAMKPFEAIMAGNKLSDVLDAAGLQTPLERIQQSFGRIAKIIGEAIYPAIEGAIWLVDKLAVALNAFIDTVGEDAFVWLTRIIGGLTLLSLLSGTVRTALIKGLVAPFKMAGGLMGSLTQKMTGLGGAMKGIGGPGKGGIMESLVGKMSPQQMLAGGAAMVMVAGAIWILAKAMQEFSTGVSWQGVLMGIVSLGALVAAIVALGVLMMSGVGTVAILAGAAAMVILAGGMWILGKAMQEFAQAAVIAIPFFEMLFAGIGSLIITTGQVIVNIINAMSAAFSNFVMDMSTLAAVAPGVLLAAGALYALAGAMTAFTIANTAAAGGGLLAGLLGGGIIDQLHEISEMAEPLASVADSMGRIATAGVSPTMTPEPIGAAVATAGIAAGAVGTTAPVEVAPVEEGATMQDVVDAINSFMTKFDEGVDLKLQGAKIGEFLAKTARK